MVNRPQFTRVKTGAGRKRALVLIVASTTLLLATAVVYLILHEPPYKPPPLEKNAVQGVPNPAENLRYKELEAPFFKFGIATTTYQQKDGSLQIYLANHTDNEAYIMCEVVDVENDRILYRSGLLRPGEYVKTLSPLKRIKNEAINIEIFVYALDMEDYMSIGQISIDNVLQPH